MLDVEGLKVSYGRIPVLHGLDIHVREGETVGVLGHNGMGKTSLLKSLMGLLDVREGRIVFGGEDVTNSSAHIRSRLGMGYVPQGRGIFRNLTVQENLEVACATRNLNSRPIVEAILEDFSRLKPILGRYGYALSGGEQQILSIARCLCASPRLILLDEPTEGIQPSIVDEIVEILKLLSQRQRMTIVLVEQKLDFISSLAERVYIMYRGRLPSQLTASELSKPEIVQEFLGMSM